MLPDYWTQVLPLIENLEAPYAALGIRLRCDFKANPPVMTCPVLDEAPDQDRALEKAWKKKLLEVHPDKPGGSETAYRVVTEAYEYLRKGRTAHDERYRGEILRIHARYEKSRAEYDRKEKEERRTASGVLEAAVDETFSMFGF